MRTCILSCILAVGLVAAPAYAKRIAMIRPGMPGSNCVNGMQENVTINVNFNIRADSFADAKKKFDDKMAQVTNFAKQQNIAKFDLQSMNYNISAQSTYEDGVPETTGYQLNGGANYIVDSSDSAFKLGEFLTKEKLQVSINANEYRNAACNQTESPMATDAARPKPGDK